MYVCVCVCVCVCVSVCECVCEQEVGGGGYTGMYISLVLCAAHYHDYCVSSSVIQILLLLLHMMISDLMRSDCGLTMRTSISAQSGHSHEERVLVCSHSVDSCTVLMEYSFIMNTKEHVGLCLLSHCLTLFQLPIKLV